MKEMKRLISLLLVCVMLIGVLPVGALAVEGEDTQLTSGEDVTTGTGEDTSEEGGEDETSLTDGEDTTTDNGEGEDTTTDNGEGEDTTTDNGEGEDTTTDNGEGEDTTTDNGEGEDTTTDNGEGEDTTTDNGEGEDTTTDNGEGEDTTTDNGEGEDTTTEGEDTTTADTQLGDAMYGIMPLAEEIETYADANTDYLFFATDRHSNTSVIGNILTYMESQVGDGAIEYVGLGGDMVNGTSSYNSSTVLGEVTAVASNLSAATVDLVYASSHDVNCTDDAGIMNKSSGVLYKSDRYYVYGITQDDMGYNDASAAVTPAAEFTAWVNGLSASDNRVIIVLSHLPIHQQRNDNLGAGYWNKALNTAATGSADGTEIIRDVLFFHGHNHTTESNKEHFYTAGSQITVESYVSDDGTATNTDTSDYIYYTYTTAGYLNANSKATLVSITDDTVTLDKYGTSSYSNLDSFTRTSGSSSDGDTDETVTVSSIAVTTAPTKTTYNVGDTLDTTGMVVTATYSDGTTGTVTGYTTSVDMSTAGTKTVTVTYEGVSTTFDITVNSGTTTESKEVYVLVDTMTVGKDYLIANGNSGTVTLLGQSSGSQATTTATVVTEGDYTYIETADTGYVWNATAHPDSSYSSYPRLINAETYAMYLSSSAVSFSSSLTNTSGAVYTRYWTYTDGVMACVSTNSSSTTYYMTYSDSAFASTSSSTTGIYIYEKQTIDVETEVTLSSIAVTTAPTTTYNVGDTFSADGMVVTATYSDGTTAAVTGYTLSDVDMTTAGTKTVTVTYTEGDVTKTTTFNITVNEVISDTATVTGIAVEGGKTEFTKGETFSTEGLVVTATYDDNGTTKTKVLSADEYTVSTPDMTTEGEQTVTVSYTYNGTTVTDEYTITVTEKPSNEVTVGGTTTTTKTKTVYVLSSGNPSGNVLIADRNTEGTVHLVANDSGDLSNTTATVVYGDCDGDGDSEYYIELTDATNELWTVSGSYTFENQDEYLRCSNGSLSVSSQSTTWSYSSNHLSYTSSGSSGNNRPGQGSSNTTYYLSYNDGWTVTSSSDSIYFYVPVEVEYDETVDTTVKYTMRAENLEHVLDTALEGYTNTESLDYCLQGNGTDLTTLPSGGSYSFSVVSDTSGIISSISDAGVVTFNNVVGEATVKVAYTWTASDGTSYTVYKNVTVSTVEPYYTLDLCEPVTDADGNTTYESITAPIVIKGVEAGDTYSVWAVIEDYNGNDIGDVADDAITWVSSNTDIATVDPTTGVVTFTGKEGPVQITAVYEYADGLSATDSVIFSVSADHYYVPEDGTDDFPEYPNEGAIRFDKTAQAVGNFSETGIAKVELSMTGVPFTTGSEIDVVVMLDMTGSMSTNGMEAAEVATKAFVKTIVVNEDGSYNDNRVAVYAFNSGSSSPYELVALDSISSDTELAAANTAIATASDKQSGGGTPFDEATKQCYDVLQAAKADGTGNDRKQFCVFMSDGGPTSYLASDGTTTITNSGSDTTAITSYLTGYTSSTSSDWAFSLPTEYYTNQMKDDGVTVYTVGLLLQTAPDNPAPWSSMSDSTYDSTTDSLTSIGSHYYFTSAILKQMASDESKYIDIFNVDNANKATAAFESIAKEILNAAEDVTVTDKIADKYTMVFEAPNTAVGNADGDQEYYIEVTSYALNPVYAADGTTITDYTRGTATSLMKLYLGWNSTTSTYYAASDNTGTAYATPTFDTTTLGTDGSYYYWTTDSTAGDSGVSVVGADGTTYYFISTGKGTHNMTSGAYAYGTLTTETVTDSDSGDTTTSSTSQDLIIATPYFVYNASTRMLVWTAEKLNSSELALTYFLYLEDSGGYTGSTDEIPAGTYETNDWAKLTYTNFNNHECEQYFPVPQMTWNGAQVSYVFYLVNEDGQPVNRAGRVVPFSEAVYVTDVYTYSIVWNDLEQVASLEASYLAEELVPDVYELYDDGATYAIHVFEDENEVNLNNHFVIGAAEDETVYTTYVFNTKADTTKYNVPGAYAASTTYLCKDYSVTDNGDGTYTYTGSNTQYAVNGSYVYETDDQGTYTIVQKTNATAVEAGFDFSNTTVAFAVVWKPELVEDVVVIDYGLDVVIDVATNDALASGVVGVRTTAPSNVTINSGTYDAAKLVTIDLELNEQKVATASVDSLTSVRVSLDKDNGMQINDPLVFYYESEVNYYDDTTLVTRGMYSSVTVIPATTIYYEDEYVELKTYTYNAETGAYDETDGWEVNSTTETATQEQDRPGQSQISAALDADNNYGYDAAYTELSTYSLGNAASITVNATKYGIASFEFYGTGFDVIGVTDTTTGAIIVDVYAANADGNGYSDTETSSTIVDTYYGYEYVDGEWVLSENNPNALYQVPVMKVEGLNYGRYKAVIRVGYDSLFDHNDSGNDTFYLDAIRIYDPAGSTSEEIDDVIEGAYAEDGELFPNYYELRNWVIDAATANGATSAINGVVFIDCDDETSDVSDYTNYGPNNELYLAAGQSVTFTLNASADAPDGYEAASVQIAWKSVGSESASAKVKIYDASATTADATTAQEIKTATDLYYDITDMDGKTVVIQNASDATAILSITNVKVTYQMSSGTMGLSTAAEDTETEEEGTGVFTVDTESTNTALLSLRRTVVEETPEETTPDTSEPEATEPDTSEPEVTEPETTEPEETEPEATMPSQEEIEEAVKETVKKVINIIKNIFSRWF